MKNIWPLVLLAGTFFIWNSKSCNLPVQSSHAPQAAAIGANSITGGPVRQWEHEVTDMPARENALPPPGGLDARAMINGARQGLAKPQ